MKTTMVSLLAAVLLMAVSPARAQDPLTWKSKTWKLAVPTGESEMSAIYTRDICSISVLKNGTGARVDIEEQQKTGLWTGQIRSKLNSNGTLAIDGLDIIWVKDKLGYGHFWPGEEGKFRLGVLYNRCVTGSEELPEEVRRLLPPKQSLGSEAPGPAVNSSRIRPTSV